MICIFNDIEVIINNVGFIYTQLELYPNWYHKTLELSSKLNHYSRRRFFEEKKLPYTWLQRFIALGGQTYVSFSTENSRFFASSFSIELLDSWKGY